MAFASVGSCYDCVTLRQVDAIFSQGVLRPLEPLALPEGSRVRVSVEEDVDAIALPPWAKFNTPKVCHPKDAADFVMEVREIDNDIR